MAGLFAGVRCVMRLPRTMPSPRLGSAVSVTRACNRRRGHFPEVGTRLAGFTFRLEDEQ